MACGRVCLRANGASVSAAEYFVDRAGLGEMKALDVVHADLEYPGTSALSTFSAMVATSITLPILAMASTMLRSTTS
jgi:hypothetical protein